MQKKQHVVVASVADVLLFVVLYIFFSLLINQCWSAYFAIRCHQFGQNIPDATACLHLASTPNTAVVIIFNILEMLSPTLIILGLRCPPTRKDFQTACKSLFRLTTWGWLLLSVVVVLVWNIGITALAKRVGVDSNPTNLELINMGMHDCPILLFFFVTIFAPCYEEIFFRRVLFGRCYAHNRMLTGLCVTAIAFALFHELPGTSHLAALAVLWTVYAGMSIILALVYWRTRSLAVSFLVHSINNTVAFMSLYNQ